jgi:deoxycytidine triphosphate deaminase
MYLSDVELKRLLPQLKVETRDKTLPFTADQIQPCSIDLRLDNVFWRQTRRRGAIDLRRSVVQELNARRYWQRLELEKNQTISLKPGHMLLGRIYEKFTIPNGFAGKIEGRSSFARLGLMVHCSADFINPGYRGHMPLQLVNVGNTEIRLSPHLPICQLMLVKLSLPAEKPYGHDELDSKYMDDDGGPSYWWKDKHVKNLKSFLARQSSQTAIQEELFRLISKREIALIERFESFVEIHPISGYTNPKELLEGFARREDRDRKFAVLKHKAALWGGPAFFTMSIASILRQPYTSAHYVVWLTTVGLLSLSAWRFFYRDPPSDYLTPVELAKLDSAGD